jgi:polyketide cyclase/dehydrase/lipid transport protein
VPSNAYHLVSHWRVRGTLEEVSDLLEDAPGLARWWSSVYSNVEQVEAGDQRGLGQRFRLLGRGWLPYVLHLEFREIERNYPHGFTVQVSGDLNGTGIWSFEQHGEDVEVTFDWTVSADKAILRWFSPLLKSLFAANHYWTMRRGQESLQLELERRRAKTDAERALIPPPPEPFHYSPAIIVMAGVALLSFISAAVGISKVRRRD